MPGPKEQVALGSIVASGGLTLAKVIVGLGSGSLAILSEAAHSALDFVATVMTYFAVRIGDKPADEQHHYGHGKVESVAALAETGLLFVLSGWVIWEAVSRLVAADGHAVEATVAAFAVIAVSIVVDFFRGARFPQSEQLRGASRAWSDRRLATRSFRFADRPDSRVLMLSASRLTD